MAALPVAEGAAQRAYLNLQVRVFDECLRPRAGHQLLLGHNLAGALDQSRQDVKGAAAEPHRLVALEQEPLRCQEPVRAKRDRVPVQGGGCRRHPFFYPIFLDCGQRNDRRRLVRCRGPGPCSITSHRKSRDLRALRPGAQAPRIGQMAARSSDVVL